MDRAPRVLAVHRYYWPDTPPYASLLRDIVGQWRADGVDVEVLSTQPSYQRQSAHAVLPRHDLVDGVRVRRISLPREHGRRWVVPFNIAVFSSFVALHVLLSRRRYDVVMTSTAPPVVLAWAASRAARVRGGKFIYHCMDIHPEIGRVSGEFRLPPVFRLLQRLDRATCASAAAVVVLSADMASALRARRPSRPLAIYEINNFALGASTRTRPTRPPTANGVIRIVFTGNIGRFQALETVIAALGVVRRASVHLTLMGDGSEVDALKGRAAEISGSNVTFLAHQDVRSARALIASADLGLVSLTGSIHRFAYPSKTMTYLAEGCPVLAVVEPDCELVAMLAREGLGMTAPPGDVAALAHVLDELAARPAVLRAMRMQARLRGPFLFDKGETLKRWSRLLDEVADRGRSRDFA